VTNRPQGQVTKEFRHVLKVFVTKKKHLAGEAQRKSLKNMQSKFSIILTEQNIALKNYEEH